MIQDILQKSKETKLLIGYNYYGGDGLFYCGFVLEYNQDFIIIQHYTKYAKEDGILVHKISDIEHFEIESIYLKNLQLMIDNKDVLNNQTYTIDKKDKPTESFVNLFESLINSKEYIIKFELNNDDIHYGFVEWCDENNFSIINIDNDGIVTGKIIFKFEDVKLYWIDSLDCRKRKFSFLNFQKNK